MRVGCPSFFGVVWGAMSLLVVAGCSADESIATGFCLTTPKANSSMKSPANPAERCVSTSGRWNANLRACYCDTGAVFSLRRGCIDGPHKNFLPSNIKLSVDGTVFERLNQRLAALLPGIPIELSDGESSSDMLIRFRNLTERDIQATLRRRAADIAGMPTYDVPALTGEGINPHQTRLACRALLGQIADQRDSSPIKDVCDAVYESLARLQNGSSSENWTFLERQLNDDVDVSEYSAANLSSGRVDGYLSFVGKSGGVYTRTLTLNLGYRWNLNILLSPFGKPMGGEIVWREAQTSGHTHMLDESRVYFDRRLQPFSEQKNTWGSRDGLRRAAGRWLDWVASGGEKFERLVTDGRSPPLKIPLRALMFEYSVDPEYFALTQRLALDRDAVSKFFLEGDFSRAWFGGGVDLEGAIAQVVPEIDSETEGHGTAVASLLAADLPNLKIGLISADSSLYQGPTEVVVERLVRKLADEAPQVVNISQDFGESIADCEKIFGPIFRRFSEQALFVVAAGNAGAAAPQNVCPASISKGHGNAIVVGGTNDDGSIGGIERSNYGKDFVQIAAPYCQDVGVYENNKASSKRLCGTSFAAPVVANAALRLLARFPYLKPKEVATLLMAACDQYGIEVECGGGMNPAKLDELVNQIPLAD